MSRYTLPTDNSTETITITFSSPVPTPSKTEDVFEYPLSVNMGFSSNRNHRLTMVGFDPGSDFSDGVAILDGNNKLRKLNLVLESWQLGSSLYVDGDPTPLTGNDNRELTIQAQAREWVISLKIVTSFEDSEGKALTTGDPKIKVIRPNM